MLDIPPDTREFTHLFPEWALSWSLDRSVGDAASFWRTATYTPTAGPASGRPLADILQGQSTPSLRCERAFLKHEAPYFGLDETTYQRTFWGLRPDFVAESDGAATLLILEAKGGRISDSVWTNPKELLYHRFLQTCTVPRTKGLLYIVPRQAAERALTCLRDQFPADSSITTGVLMWEQLLPVIYDRLIETALDQIIQEMHGLQALRTWRSGEA